VKSGTKPAKIQQKAVSNCRKARYNPSEREHQSPKNRAMANLCKHPRVRIVSRLEDSEFVEETAEKEEVTEED
jgi:hypothetical protein